LPLFPSDSVSIAYFHFPDPWWKKRHAKRLVLGPALVAELARVIVPSGELFVQTDVEERALAYESTIATDGHFHPLSASARVADNPYAAQSPRERRAIQDGLPIFRLKYTRC
jgi:tRNA (guanine-N7-)-methyltransferase